MTPIFRIFDVQKAKEFYVEFLGFEVAFEHRFGDNFPLYLGLSFGNCSLHLSEHYGDACPGAHVRIGLDGIADYLAKLSAKDYRFAKPGAPEATPWQTLEATITDPFGNRLTFVEDQAGASASTAGETKAAAPQ
jgi:catechol 2,3-dioxygenase-like lactoylglutathione lyase family enzyme